MNSITKLIMAAGVSLFTLGTWESAQAAIIAQKTFQVSSGVGGLNTKISENIKVTLSINDEFLIKDILANAIEVPAGVTVPIKVDIPTKVIEINEDDLSTEDEFALLPFFISKPSLFKSLIVTPADVGKTLIATQATDPDFNIFIEKLKNSKAISIFVNTIYLTQDKLSQNLQYKFPHIFGTGIGAGSDFPNDYLSFAPSGKGPIDFSGYNIQKISLRIDSLTINNAQDYANCNLTATVTIEGEPSKLSTPVPEPSSKNSRK